MRQRLGSKKLFNMSLPKPSLVADHWSDQEEVSLQDTAASYDIKAIRLPGRRLLNLQHPAFKKGWYGGSGKNLTNP